MDASALSRQNQKDVRPMLDLVDEMRRLGVEKEVPLPQIAVMGDQSCGKSSVLEALSGVPFPRGTGLVTRCPCQLTMKRSSDDRWRGSVKVLRQTGQELAGDMNVAKEVTSPSALTEAIEVCTTHLTRESGTFSSDSIVVEVRAPHVPDLTIIDLPGIVRTATAGQDMSVVTQVNSTIEKYLAQERTIILAIVPANQDVATVDILERALRVDPTGARTIGVLTKPDLVGDGGEDEVVAVLKNERKPLKLGYVMVKNRSARELKQGVMTTPREQERAERDFFRNHPVWRTMDPKLLGVGNLTTKLTALLTKRIVTHLPELKYELQEHFNAAEKNLIRLGAQPPSEEGEKAREILRRFGDYSSTLMASARGDYRNERLARADEDSSQLRLRAVADRVFRDLEAEISSLKPDFEARDFTNKLHQELAALRGRELPGLLNSYFFYGFMARHVEMWRPVIEDARAELYDAARDAGIALADDAFPTYPAMAACVRQAVGDYLYQSGDALIPKIDDVFKHEADPFISKNELGDAILKVRFDRFDAALQAVLDQCGDHPPEGPESEAPAPAASSSWGLGASTGGDGAVEPPPEEEAPPPPEEPSQDEGPPEHPLREMVLGKLGRWYMANHGVTSMSMVEDMRTVLIAYWGVAAKRITENVCMLFENHLLAALGQDIEKALLDIANEEGAAHRLLVQDPAIDREREETRQKKSRVAAALTALQRVAPDVVAVPPPGAKRGSFAAAAPPAVDGGSGVPRAPREAAPAPETPPLETFTFTSNGDNGGFIYWLGTSGQREKFVNPMDRGRVRVTSSGLAKGAEDLLVARKRQPCWTKNEPNAWICLDLGRNRRLSPTHYTLCSGASEAGFDLLSWAFEGYDAARDEWVDLHTEPPPPLTSPWGVQTIKVDARGRRWRYLRVRVAGPNLKNTYELPVCAWEFYGALYQAN